jgi:hypothetical protein
VSGLIDQRLHVQNDGAIPLIISAYDRATNFEFADRYLLTVNSIDINNKKISASLSAETLHNPFVNVNITDIVADATNYNIDIIIPGFGFKFADAATLSVGQTAEIWIGDLLVDGTITAGDQEDADATVEKLGVRNMHTASLSGCKASIVPKPRPKNINGNPILAAKCSSIWSRDLTEFTLRFTGYVPGSNQVCQIDGGGDISIICDATNWNEIYPGLFVIFNNSVNITSIDVATIRVSDGYKYVQLAINDGGTPGTWTNSSVIIMQDDQSVPGKIDSEEIGYFWKRVIPSTSTNPSGNPREYQLLVQGDITS